jgi:CMP-N-acetylneuraminic acid synthetase
MAWQGRSVLAVVPARSGSRGIPHKNLLKIGGETLIARAGRTLAALPWIDARVISTDSEEYAREGERAGLAAPFRRPPELAGDAAGAVETWQHAVLESEREFGRMFDLLLLVEPTSPLREPEDLERTVHELVAHDAESAVTVSAIDAKCHPLKVFRIDRDRLEFYEPAGAGITTRQQLEQLYARNGVCYAVTRRQLLDRHLILTEGTRAIVIDRPIVNIDGPLDVLLAQALFARHNSGFTS